MSRKQQVKCHGDINRFEIIADFIYNYFGNDINYIADVAGGQMAEFYDLIWRSRIRSQKE